MTAFYEMLNALKHGNSALNASGQLDTMQTFDTTSDDILAFTRTAADGNKVTVIVNLSDNDRPVTFTDLAPSPDSAIDYFTGAPAEMPSHLGAWQYVVWTPQI